MYTKTIDVSVDLNSWKDPRHPPPRGLKQLRRVETVDAHAALLSVGRLSRPPTFTGMHPSDFWAWLRYFSAVSTRARLCLQSDWGNLDPHQKTILSDDWGVGFTTHIVERALSVESWADTGYVARFLKPDLFKSRRALQKGGQPKRGPAKSPDFIGFIRGGGHVVLECKGTQSSRAALERQVMAGVAQKRAIVFKGARRVEHLCAGIFVPLETSNSHAQILITDPPPHEPLVVPESFGPQQITSAIIRGELGGFARTMGARRWATEVLNSESTAKLDRKLLGGEVRQVERGEREFLAVERQFELPSGTRIGSAVRSRLTASMMIDAAVVDSIGEHGIASYCLSRAEQMSGASESGDTQRQDEAEQDRAIFEGSTGIRIEVGWA